MKSIRTKLAVLVVSAVVSAVVLASMASAWRDVGRRFDAKKKELDGVAAGMATALAYPLVRNEKNEIVRMLRAIGRIPGLSYARVTDSAGRTVHELGVGIVLSDKNAPIRANRDIGPLSALHLSTYPVASPIISEGKEVGELVLLADVSELRSALIESILSSLLVGLCAALAALLLTGRLQSGITRPIAQLTGAMEDVRVTRNYALTVPKASDDEIGMLVDSYNGMLAEIRARGEALEAHRDRLELEVAERTVELATAKRVAEDANAAKSDFLASMSHEIRTPMNGMLVMAELMAAAGLAPRLQRYADVLVKSGQSLLSIINDILDFSKIEAGRLELETVPLAPNQIVDDVLKLFDARAKEKGLALTGYVEPGVARQIAADPVRLTQVLSNLVSNALKFTEAGGVAIRLSSSPGDAPDRTLLSFSVSDTGIGIPADKIATVFEAFAQADQSTTRRFGGTGIGLTICRRLARAMGGDIGIHSMAGVGSIFTLTVPMPVIEPAGAHTMIAEGENRIAIVLEPGALRNVLGQYVADRGFIPVMFTPDAATAGGDIAEMRAVITTAEPLEALAAAGRTAPTQAIRVVLSSLDDARASRMLDGGQADLLLGLPLSTDEVAACLDQIVGGRSALVRGGASKTVSAGTLSFRGRHVLIADDSPVNREVLIEALARVGIEATCVEDGRQAVAAVKSRAFDLVFMDGSMPVLDGFEATREIRAWEAGQGRSALPIVAVTAHVVGAQADLWRSSGMSDCVTKPYTLQRLHTCLLRWLGEASTAAPLQAHAEPHVAPEPVAPAVPAPAAVPDAVPEAAGPSVVALFDDTVLDSVRSMQRPGDDLVGRVLGLYRQHAPRALEALRKQVASGDGVAIANAAHALKSLSRNIGALRVGDLCDELETVSRLGDVANAEVLCASIAVSLEETLGVLDSRAREKAA